MRRHDFSTLLVSANYFKSDGVLGFSDPFLMKVCVKRHGSSPLPPRGGGHVARWARHRVRLWELGAKQEGRGVGVPLLKGGNRGRSLLRGSSRYSRKARVFGVEFFQ